MSAAAHRVKEPSMFARAPKNETPASRRALRCSPSKGCTSKNRPTTPKTRALAKPGATRPSEACRTRSREGGTCNNSLS